MFNAMSETRRYGLIGAGMMGLEHIQNIALVDGPQLVAMADPHRPSLDLALRLAPNVTVYDDHLSMMAAEKLDAVIIATPNFTHFDIVKTLLDYPVALLIEKPLCTTVEDATTLHEMTKDGERLIWTGLEYRYMPPVQEFIKQVHGGVTGSLNMVSIREHRFPFLPKVKDWNRFSRNTGGTLVEKCCHFFDLMRVIVQDEPVRVFATGGQSVNHLDEVYNGEVSDILDNAFVSVDFKGGARAILDLCMFAEGVAQQEEIYALGDVGRLDVQIPSANLIWSPRNRLGGFTKYIATPEAAMKAGHHHGATFYQLQDFHQALVNDGKPTVSVLDGLRSVQMGAAAHKSIETGRPVDLNFEDGRR